jgi:hypothetical protein
MSPTAITPSHRPEIPADLLDNDFTVRHLDDGETLADLGFADVRQAAEYYRGKFRLAAANDLCRQLLETNGRTDPTELEEICRNVLTLRAHMHVKHDYGPVIDWTTVIDNDIESNVAINHHFHIAALALAYQRQGEKRYAAHAVRMLRSWFEQSPAPTSEAKLQWRSLEVGGRLTQAWPILGVCLCDYEGFTDRDLFDLARWTWLSVRHLRRFVGPPNNWLQIESIGALCGLAFLGPGQRGRCQQRNEACPSPFDSLRSLRAPGMAPGTPASRTTSFGERGPIGREEGVGPESSTAARAVPVAQPPPAGVAGIPVAQPPPAVIGGIPAAAGWADLFWKRLDWINANHFLPDGMQAENSPGYHTFPWWRLYSAGLWIELFGGQLPPDYRAEQVKRAQPLWMLRQPDGTLPPLSDCGPQPTSADGLLAFVRRHQPQANLPDPAALAARGQLPDEHRVCHLPYAGYTVCRTSWDSDAEYLLFDHGFYGTNHQHEDKLTFLYGAGGRMLLGDGGIYRYSRDDWEHYFRGAYSHNLIMVDGKQQCRSLRAWQGRTETLPDPDCRYTVHPNGPVVLSGWYRDGFAARLHHLWDRAADRADELGTLDESIQHQRLLVWLPGKGLLVLDRLTGQGLHQVDQIFHLMPFCGPAAQSRRFRPGKVVISEPAACLPAEGDQPGVLLVSSDPAFRSADRCGEPDPPRGWTSLWGQQPSHDVWRSGRVCLPLTLGTWVQPWRLAEGPGEVSLQIQVTDGKIGFGVRIDLSGLIYGTIDLADLSLTVG